MSNYNGDVTLLPSILLDYANACKWKGELAKAEVLYKNALDKYPNNLSLIEALAECLNLEGKHKEAIEFYDHALSIRTDQSVSGSVRHGLTGGLKILRNLKKI